MSYLNDQRVKLIDHVGRVCSFWNATATNDAIESIRKIDDPDLQMRARLSVAKMDASIKAGNEIVEHINALWPHEAPK